MRQGGATDPDAHSLVLENPWNMRTIKPTASIRAYGLYTRSGEQDADHHALLRSRPRRSPSKNRCQSEGSRAAAESPRNAVRSPAQIADVRPVHHCRMRATPALTDIQLRHGCGLPYFTCGPGAHTPLVQEADAYLV